MIVLANVNSHDDAGASLATVVAIIDMSSRTIVPGEASDRYFRETYLGDGIQYIQSDGTIYPPLSDGLNLWYGPDGTDRFLVVTLDGSIYLSSKQGIVHWMERLGQPIPVELGMAPRDGQVWT